MGVKAEVHTVKTITLTLSLEEAHNLGSITGVLSQEQVEAILKRSPLQHSPADEVFETVASVYFALEDVL